MPRFVDVTIAFDYVLPSHTLPTYTTFLRSRCPPERFGYVTTDFTRVPHHDFRYVYTLTSPTFTLPRYVDGPVYTHCAPRRYLARLRTLPFHIPPYTVTFTLRSLHTTHCTDGYVALPLRFYTAVLPIYAHFHYTRCSEFTPAFVYLCLIVIVGRLVDSTFGYLIRVGCSRYTLHTVPTCSPTLVPFLPHVSRFYVAVRSSCRTGYVGSRSRSFCPRLDLLPFDALHTHVWLLPSRSVALLGPAAGRSCVPYTLWFLYAFRVPTHHFIVVLVTFPHALALGYATRFCTRAHTAPRYYTCDLRTTVLHTSCLTLPHLRVPQRLPLRRLVPGFCRLLLFTVPLRLRVRSRLRSCRRAVYRFCYAPAPLGYGSEFVTPHTRRLHHGLLICCSTPHVLFVTFQDVHTTTRSPIVYHAFPHATRSDLFTSYPFTHVSRTPLPGRFTPPHVHLYLSHTHDSAGSPHHPLLTWIHTSAPAHARLPRCRHTTALPAPTACARLPRSHTCPVYASRSTHTGYHRTVHYRTHAIYDLSLHYTLLPFSPVTLPFRLPHTGPHWIPALLPPRTPHLPYATICSRCVYTVTVVLICYVLPRSRLLFPTPFYIPLHYVV